MVPEQITAIAREYAEEINPTNKLNDYPEAKMIADMMRNALREVTAEQAKDFEGFLRFLLRRYCLVEKGKLSEMYDAAMEVSRLPKSVEARGYAISRLQTLKSLFPDIAKEVEDA